MAEYIERKRAIVDACNALELYPSEYSQLEDALNRTPCADVAPVRHGRWLYEPKFDSKRPYHCSLPDCGASYQGKFLYCPNCGAKMDGET